MIPTETYDRATLGVHGEPCVECRTPLARDQRYCLSCGARRPGLSAVLTGASVGGAVAPPGEIAPPPIASPPQPRRRMPHFSADATVLAGAACLLLALLVGVLIGRAGRDTTQPRSAAPQVITVGGSAPAAAATATPTAAATGTATPEATATEAPAKGKAKKDAKAIQDIQGASGEDYSKKSEKLPKTLTTPGKPPPKDNKPAGGGSESETFK